jgi:protein ImuB
MTSPVTRTIVLWCPDWPVTQTAKERALPDEAPVALIDRGLVFACSEAARHEGVRRGLRVREAQARCPGLHVLPYDPAPGARAFEAVLTEIDGLMPGVQVIRPGTCALRSRGPSRYYGGEEQAAAALLACMDRLGVSEARVGIADGPFTAEQAARSTSAEDRLRIVPPGEAASFLADLPIETIGTADLVPLLTRLGIYTLGALARLDATDVRERFGETGARAHLRAQGLDGSAVIPRTPPKELDRRLDFEPPLDRVDQVAFAFRASAELFVAALTRAGLVCTSIRIEMTAESGRTSARTWLHPRVFTASDVVDRVRWQLQGSGSIDSGLSSPIVSVLVSPESVDDIGHHEEGLWGGGADERIHHGLSRVQSMLGHDAVLTALIGGGRAPGERRLLVPWGDRTTGVPSPAKPWPGSLPPPQPTSVFSTPSPATVLQPGGEPADVDERGRLTGPIARFSPSGRSSELRPVSAWAGPWPAREHWWDPSARRSVNRFQVVDEEGDAWLLVLEDHRWWTEARYD